MATAKKTTKGTTAKVLNPSKKITNAPKATQSKIEAPQLGTTVQVHTAQGSYSANVSGKHGGLRLDLVVIPATGSPYSLSCVNHISNTENLPYWE